MINSEACNILPIQMVMVDTISTFSHEELTFFQVNKILQKSSPAELDPDFTFVAHQMDSRFHGGQKWKLAGETNTPLAVHKEFCEENDQKLEASDEPCVI